MTNSFLFGRKQSQRLFVCIGVSIALGLFSLPFQASAGLIVDSYHGTTKSTTPRSNHYQFLGRGISTDSLQYILFDVEGAGTSGSWNQFHVAVCSTPDYDSSSCNEYIANEPNGTRTSIPKVQARINAGASFAHYEHIQNNVFVGDKHSTTSPIIITPDKYVFLYLGGSGSSYYVYGGSTHTENAYGDDMGCDQSTRTPPTGISSACTPVGNLNHQVYDLSSTTAVSPNDFQTTFLNSTVSGASSSTVTFNVSYTLFTQEYNANNRPDIISITTYPNDGGGTGSWNKKKIILPLTDGTHSKSIVIDDHTYADGEYNYDVHFWNLNNDDFTFIQTSIVGIFTVSGGVVTSYQQEGVYTSQNPPNAPQVCSLTNLGGCFQNLVDYFFSRQLSESNDTTFLTSTYTLFQDTFLEKHPFAWPRDALITIYTLADDYATSSTTPQELDLTIDLAPTLSNATTSGNMIQMYELQQTLDGQSTEITFQPISQGCDALTSAMATADEDPIFDNPCSLFKSLTTGLIWLAVVFFYFTLTRKYFNFLKS